VDSDQTRIKRAVDAIETSLSSATDLKPLQRKNVAYWTIGTHGLPNTNTYPILSILGPTNTGKNEILAAVEQFAYKPERLILRNSSEVVLRDFFIKTCNGTAILDEADASAKSDSHAFEGMLKTRFSRETAVVTVNRENEETGGWRKATQSTFGALVTHRQHPFHDPSLDTRVILIDTHPNLDRIYTRQRNGGNSLDGLILDFADVDIGLPQRLMDSYSPLVNVALLAGDSGYVDQLVEFGEEAVERLRNIQEGEPTTLVLAGILAHSINEESTWKPRTKISELGEWLNREHAMSLTPRQIATIARSLRIETVKSNGVTVIAPQINTLLDACERYGYTEDEAYDRLLAYKNSGPSRLSRGASLAKAAEQ
jgi:hypothetical protein